MKNLCKYISLVAIISLFTCCAEDIIDVTGSISGIVKDYTTGLTVENCQVALSPSGNSVSTDANGRYTFAKLNPGTYTLTFTKTDYLDQSASVEVLAGQNITKDIQIVYATGSISGIVKDNVTSQFVANCQVTLSPSGKTVSTDANGQYTFGKLDPGTYTLSFTKSGYLDQSASVEVLAGQNITKDINLEATGSISGIVRDFKSSQTIANCQVTLSPLGKTVFTDANGHYIFDNLNPGTYTLTYSKAEYIDQSATVEVLAGQTTTKDISLGGTMGGISGIVKDYTTSQTIANCQVALSPSGKTVFTDANGRYIFDKLNAGTYTLSFSKIGYLDQSTTVEVLAGQTTTKDIQLEATEVFTVSTSVLDFGDGNATLSFALQNHSAVKYDFNIVNNIAWLNLSQTNGTIQPNNRLNITATVDRSLVGYGSYDKTITINYTGATSGNVVLRIVMQKVEKERPVVITNEATDITANSFSISGQITSTGGEKVTAYGHCWSYDPHPTIDNEHTDLGQTIENIRFNSKIYCSLVNTAVYVRAYAVNSQGVSYSNEVQVTTPKGDNPSEDDGDFAGGSGTAYDPYQIKTAASMMRMKDYPDAHFALAADIDMEGYPWTPIPLETSFDGNNHTIYNLTINPYITSDQIGLFSSILEDGVVKNLTMHGPKINFPNKSKIGAIAGACAGTITNCHVVLTSASAIVGDEYVGGLVGFANGGKYANVGAIISACTVSSTISSAAIIGNKLVGGAIGELSYNSSSTVSEVHVNASIAGSNSVGGVVGYIHKQRAEQVSFEGTITALTTNGKEFGGLVGAVLDGHLSSSKANAVIELMGTTNYVGGLVGASYGWYPSITACYSQGQIIGKIGTNSTGSQGILGYVSGSCPIDYCYTLYNSTLNESESFSIYDLVGQFSSPINIAEIMRTNCSSEASEYWDFNRTWTWKGTANGKTVTAICPKLKWEK